MRVVGMFLWVAVGVACSGVAPEYEEPKPEPPRPRLGYNYTPANSVQCSQGCELAFPAAVPSCPYRNSATCLTLPEGWLDTVPACGQAALWIQSCTLCDGTCCVGVFYEALQTCK